MTVNGTESGKRHCCPALEGLGSALREASARHHRDAPGTTWIEPIRVGNWQQPRVPPQRTALLRETTRHTKVGDSGCFGCGYLGPCTGGVQVRLRHGAGNRWPSLWRGAPENPTKPVENVMKKENR